MRLVIPGNVMGRVISGVLTYSLWGEHGKWPHHYQWNNPFSSRPFQVTVIPHHLSMLNIPEQNATANQPFVYPLKSAVNYYDENQMAGVPAQAVVHPIEQDGLRFDPASFSIVGTPKRMGTYQFSVSVHNANGATAAQNLLIKVQANIQDKPRFKPHYSMVSALPEQKYSMNLMELVELRPGYWVTNQVSFRIESNSCNPKWLRIAHDDATLLVGDVPPDAAGQEVDVLLVASSNTGGDSDPLKVRIPIAYDLTKKPEINAFKLEQAAGTNIYENLADYVKDPAHNSSLKVVLDKVEPAASWLSISSSNPTVLEGVVPLEAVGQLFQLTLRASTSIGGSSDPIKIPFQIDFDPDKKPRFKAANPVMPMIYPDQFFYYDFAANRDVFPEYEEVPYEIKYAEDFVPPTWLRIENNKLIAERIPGELNEDIRIKVVIKNTPGGVSEVYSLDLTVMN
ncbi:Ig domain-containing protein [Legionella fallonii]|uniref:Cadherin domain-containing protein n=1 Tax=Legionella fallonii LLAP-10 TaxID=1212491 RepID=A0A098G463_9GAMM|nr:Ig domain-containing protein [Legionella fallonii]CEG56766.1 protein of unknown function [Cadherin-like] [Legionella fallonii LLAP-10]